MVQYSHINGRKHYGTSSAQQRHNDTGSASSNQKTVAKWKKRTSADDLTTGPKNPHSSLLSPEEEAAIVAF